MDSGTQKHPGFYARCRIITSADWPHIMTIQHQAYDDVKHESLAVLASKATLSPETNWVAYTQTELVGYLLAHPWKIREPLPLQYELTALPPNACTFYIHDLALLPNMRGHGVGTQLVEHALSAAREKRFTTSALVAVQGTSTFWTRFGYRPVPLQSASSVAILQKYGENVQYMEMAL